MSDATKPLTTWHEQQRKRARVDAQIEWPRTAYDTERDVDNSGLLDDGQNLVQQTTPLTIVDHTADVITLVILRHVLLNMRDMDLMRKYSVVHTRLRENVTLDERKRVLTLLNSIEIYAVDTIPHYLGCMRLAGDTEGIAATFRLACGKRVAVARLLYWLCDNSLANHLLDKETIARARQHNETTTGIGLGALGHKFKVFNSCETAECVNPQHQRRCCTAAYVSKSSELDAELRSVLNEAPPVDSPSYAALQTLRNYTANRDREWLLTERELCRDSYFMSPIEMSLPSTDDVCAQHDDESSSSSSTGDKIMRLLTTKSATKRRIVNAAPLTDSVS